MNRIFVCPPSNNNNPLVEKSVVGIYLINFFFRVRSEACTSISRDPSSSEVTMASGETVDPPSTASYLSNLRYAASAYKPY